jgi:hypothetical protein
MGGALHRGSLRIIHILRYVDEHGKYTLSGPRFWLLSTAYAQNHVANKYIGQSSLDGLTLVSMQTQLTQDLVGLQTRGYCTRPNVKITSTPARQRSGHAMDK